VSNDVTRAGRLGNSPIIVGRFTYGFENVTVRQWGEGAALRIGAFCAIADSVSVFLGGNHRADWMTTFPFGHVFQDELGGERTAGVPATDGDVVVGNDVWIGSRVTILSGVRVGDGAVLAANANVVKDVEPYTIVGGNPARVVKSRFGKEIVDLLLQLRWWDLPLDQVREISAHLCAPPDAELLRRLVATYRA